MAERDRLTRYLGAMGGATCIRGMGFTVCMIPGQIGVGVTVDDLLIDHPSLGRDVVPQAVRYAGLRAWEYDFVTASP